MYYDINLSEKKGRDSSSVFPSFVCVYEKSVKSPYVLIVLNKFEEGRALDRMKREFNSRNGKILESHYSHFHLSQNRMRCNKVIWKIK